MTIAVYWDPKQQQQTVFTLNVLTDKPDKTALTQIGLLPKEQANLGLLCFLIQGQMIHLNCKALYSTKIKCGGSLVECLSWDRGVVCLSFIGGTALCP